MKNLQVTDNKEKKRFEIQLDGEMAFIDYTEQNNVVALTHTEVPVQFRGKNIGSQLVKNALDTLHSEGKRVQPLCPFVAAYIERHPEYQPLVA